MKRKLTALACALAICSMSATSTSAGQVGEQSGNNALLAQPIADTASKLERELPNGFLWTGRNSSDSVTYVVKHGFKGQAEAIVGDGFEITESAGLTRRELDEYRHNLFQVIDKHVEDVEGLSVSVDPKNLAAEVRGRSKLINRSVGFDSSSAEEEVRTLTRQARDQAYDRLGITTTKQVEDTVNLTLEVSELVQPLSFGGPTDLHTRGHNGHYCTTGFVIKNGSSYGMTTAAHCMRHSGFGPIPEYIRSKPGAWTGDNRDAWSYVTQEQSTFTMNDNAPGWWGDAGAIKTSRSNNPSPTHATGWRAALKTELAFDSIADPRDGHIVCMFGQTTGGPTDQEPSVRHRWDMRNPKCGRVHKYVNMQICQRRNKNNDCTLSYYIRGLMVIKNTRKQPNLGARTGDSGGPIHWRNNAHGVLVAADRERLYANPISTFSGSRLMPWKVVCSRHWETPQSCTAK